MKKGKWLIWGLLVLVLIVLVAAAWFFKRNAVSIGHEHSLSELSEDEAVMALDWGRMASEDVIVVNKQGKWKTVKIRDWMGEDYDGSYYSSYPIECWDAILQDDKIPWQKSKLPFHWYLLKRAINIRPFRLALPKSRGSYCTAPRYVSYFAVCYDEGKRKWQMIGGIDENGDGQRNQWDLRLLGMRAALDQLDRERERMED